MTRRASGRPGLSNVRGATRRRLRRWTLRRRTGRRGRSFGRALANATRQTAVLLQQGANPRVSAHRLPEAVAWQRNKCLAWSLEARVLFRAFVVLAKSGRLSRTAGWWHGGIGGRHSRGSLGPQYRLGGRPFGWRSLADPTCHGAVRFKHLAHVGRGAQRCHFGTRCAHARVCLVITRRRARCRRASNRRARRRCRSWFDGRGCACSWVPCWSLSRHACGLRWS